MTFQGDENITVVKDLKQKQKNCVANIEKITYQGNIGQKKVCNGEKKQIKTFFCIDTEKTFKKRKDFMLPSDLIQTLLSI